MSVVLLAVAQKLGEQMGLRVPDIRYLANVFELGSFSVTSSGGRVCTAGQPSDSVILLVRGVVDVMKEDSSGTLCKLAEVKAPSLMGHMGELDGSPRSATCEVSMSSDAGVVIIDAEKFRQLMTQPDKTGQAARHMVLAALMRQLGNTNKTVASLLDGKSTSTSGQNSNVKSNNDLNQDSEDGLNERDMLLLQSVLRGWAK